MPPLVRYFMTPKGRGRNRYMPLFQALLNQGRRVYSEPVPADISIVMDGKIENPLCLQGEKILIAWPEIWVGGKKGWEGFYKPILEEYYDVIVDMTGLNIKEAVKEILNHETAATNRLQ